MEIKQAQIKVDELIKEYGDYWEPLSMYARLVEEVGELGRTMNIKFGGKKSKSDKENENSEEELADVLFTTLAIANKLNINLDKEFNDKLNKDFEKCKGVY